MQPIFAIGDVHGELTLLKEMLTNWDAENEQLIFVGDLIDRGEDPAGVVKVAKQLVDTHNAIVLRGNHEQMLLDWLQNPEEKMNYYTSQGGLKTIQSFLADKLTKELTPTEMADALYQEAAQYISFIAALPFYYEKEDYFFVHAGVDLALADWRQTPDKDLIWIREPFLFGENHTDKTFVFGHTPVQSLHEDGSSNIWISEDKTRIDIDGGAVFGGALHGVVLTDTGISEIYTAEAHK